jgi:hypothetical protein
MMNDDDNDDDDDDDDNDDNDNDDYDIHVDNKILDEFIFILMLMI